MSNICVNCGNEKPATAKYRKLCWTCTNWKRHYGTVVKAEVEERKEIKRGMGKFRCVMCQMKDSRVVPGNYTSTGKPMHAHCSWAAADLIEALKDPVKMYLLKDRLGIN